MDRRRYKCISSESCGPCPVAALAGGLRIDADQALQAALDDPANGHLLTADAEQIAAMANRASHVYGSRELTTAVTGALALVAAGQCE